MGVVFEELYGCPIVLSIMVMVGKDIYFSACNVNQSEPDNSARAHGCPHDLRNNSDERSPLLHRVYLLESSMIAKL